MQFNNSLSNPLSPPTGAGGGGEEICRDFLKVYFIICYTSDDTANLTERVLLFQQGACFRENCKYSHAHAEGLCAQLPQVSVSSFFLFFADAEIRTNNEPNF